MRSLFLILLIGTLITSCKHDPFTYSGTYSNPNDTTTTNPIDSCDPNIVYFNDVSGIFNGCAQSGCHDNNASADFSLTSYNAIVNELLDDKNPNDWFESELYEVLVKKASDPDKRMPPPPLDPLPLSEIELLKKWVEQGATDEECYGLCDTANVLVTYNSHIINIMNSSCRVCHSGTAPAGSLDLTIPITVSDNAELILSRMKLPVGDASFMPQGGGKSQCNIDLVKKWIDNGKPL